MKGAHLGQATFPVAQKHDKPRGARSRKASRKRWPSKSRKARQTKDDDGDGDDSEWVGDSSDSDGESIGEVSAESDFDDDDGYDDDGHSSGKRKKAKKSRARATKTEAGSPVYSARKEKARVKRWQELTSEMKNLASVAAAAPDTRDAEEERQLAAAIAESKKMAAAVGNKRSKGSPLGRRAKRTRPPSGAYAEQDSGGETRPEDVLTDSGERKRKDSRRRKRRPSPGATVDGPAPWDGSNRAMWKTNDQWVELLSTQIVGQAVAIRKMSALLERLSMQMIIQPVVMLMSGPSGTGKSSAIDIITRELGVRDTPALVTVVGTQFVDEASVTDICGSAKGLVGSDKEDSVMHLLCKAHQHVQEIQQRRGGSQPPVVFVFDEVDKAHVAIWDTLMELFDKGAYGGKGSFSGTIKSLFIILVANWGAFEISQQPSISAAAAAAQQESGQAAPEPSLTSDPYDEMRENIIMDMYAVGLKEHHIGRVPDIIPYAVISPADVLTGVYTHTCAIDRKLQAEMGVHVNVPRNHKLLTLLATLVSSTQGFRPIVAAIGNVLSSVVSSARFQQRIVGSTTLKILETPDFPTRIDGKPITVTVCATEVMDGPVVTRPLTEWPVKLYL